MDSSTVFACAVNVAYRNVAFVVFADCSIRACNFNFFAVFANANFSTVFNSNFAFFEINSICACNCGRCSFACFFVGSSRSYSECAVAFAVVSNFEGIVAAGNCSITECVVVFAAVECNRTFSVCNVNCFNIACRVACSQCTCCAFFVGSVISSSYSVFVRINEDCIFSIACNCNFAVFVENSCIIPLILTVEVVSITCFRCNRIFEELIFVLEQAECSLFVSIFAVSEFFAGVESCNAYGFTVFYSNINFAADCKSIFTDINAFLSFNFGVEVYSAVIE